jgi:5-formyltetrahydrofolate cyclo-ligase
MNPPSLQEEKRSLRVCCLARRSALPPEQAAACSRAIQRQILGLEEYSGACLVHIYVSTKDNEVDTRGLIGLSLERGKRVAIPVVQRGTRRLRHAEIGGLEQLEIDPWGLSSPPPGHSAWIEALETIDLVIVPGIAFDARGRRLGFGGGYYDRFLAGIRAPKIGLTYGCLMLDEVPHEAHDVAVDVVVTENAVHRTGVSESSGFR